MKIIDVSNAPLKPNPHNIKVSKLHESEHVVAVHMTLEPGEQVKPHSAAVDIFFFVLEGEPTIEIGGEKKAVPANHLVEGPKDTPHGVHNEKDKTARILVVKTPRPA